MSLAKKKRLIQDVFVRGGVLEVPSGGEVIPLWVQVLNGLEVQQVEQDARAAMLAAMLGVDQSEEEQLQIDRFLAGSSDVAVARVIVAARDREKFAIAAYEELTSEEGLQEKVELWQNHDADAATEGEAEVFARVSGELEVELQRRINMLVNEREEELIAGGRVGLEKEYRLMYRSLKGQEAFMVRRRLAEILYSVRDCNAVLVDGDYDHAVCDHSVQFLSSVREVGSMGDSFLDLAYALLRDLTVGLGDAGKSVGPKVS